MAATIVDDDVQDDGNLDNEQDAKRQEQATEKDSSPAPEPKKKSKFEGKTPEEIEKAYEELEQRFGRQGEEVGELRKLADQILRSTLEQKSTKAAVPARTEPEATDDDSEFFINPRKAIKKLLEEDDTIRDLKTHKTESQQERAQRIFKQKHPDTEEILADPGFQEWVKASKVRTDLMIRAHTQLDIDAGDELFSTYKELKQVKAKAAAAAEKETAEQIVDAQKKAAGAPSGTTGAEDSSSKKVYSRRAMMKLKLDDPETYAARNDEFLLAYAEGRVKP